MVSSKVNRPMDVEKKEKSVNEKLRLYGIIQGFQNGKVPSNRQIDVALNTLLKSEVIAQPPQELSNDGKLLLEDLRNVIEQAKVLVLSKNYGELFQQFLWETKQVTAENANVPGAPISKETAQQHGNQALEGLRTLGQLLVSNGQFRKLLSDATVLLRDIAGDAAEKSARKINPSQDALSQIDKPAEDNVWHDNPSGSAIKDQIKSTINRNKPANQSDLKDAASNASGAASSTGGNVDAQTAANTKANAAVNAAGSTIQARASDNIPEDTKNEAKEKQARYRAETKDYLKSKFPEERRGQTIYRLKKMIVEVQGHPEYQKAIDTLLSLAEQYAGHASDIGKQSIGSVKGAHEDNAVKNAEKHLKALLERFANNTSIEGIFEAVNDIYRDADRDPELKRWFKAMDAYIRKCLKQQGFVMEDQATEDWDRLYDQGNYLLRDRYRDHTDRVVDEIKFFGDQFTQDPKNMRFGEACQKLFTDLGNDQKSGKPTFKPHLVEDIIQHIVPKALENFGYVPMPRIEFKDPTMDVVIENLVIESDNLTPNLVEFYAENTFRYVRRFPINDGRHRFQLKVAGIQMDLRNVGYYIKKKQGFPSITDTGLANIFLGGSGLSFTLSMSTPEKTDRQNFFKIDKVDVDVKNFSIKLVESHHKVLFGAAKPLMLKILRPALQKVLEGVIKQKATELDAFLYKIKQEADRVQEEVADNPENAPNVYSRYVNAFQQKMRETKQKAAKVQASVDEKEVKMTFDMNQSIFPDVELPNSVCTKATEYKDLAGKGEKWESAVFSIGSANATIFPSPAIPQPPAKATRKQPPARLPVGTGGRATGTQPAAGANNGSANPFGQQVDNAFSSTAQNINGNTTLGANNPILAGTGVVANV